MNGNDMEKLQESGISRETSVTDLQDIGSNNVLSTDETTSASSN
eukprot:CAMPEP_0196821282 /NCGR_PEP_ID=MMETSP1362-20130617/78613_1 /TAXON_ID=163516 /ORGANISM="Leptocylindrus danicus, Strain CCMP1856" /LENGTH=43 /DNA_ID= /DNA_START= /DNA_END= /DNA_ORIENTATION=